MLQFIEEKIYEFSARVLQANGFGDREAVVFSNSNTKACTPASTVATYKSTDKKPFVIQLKNQRNQVSFSFLCRISVILFTFRS